MKRVFGVIHAIVACEDCAWQAPSYKNAQAVAAIHAKRHRHRVSGEIGVRLVYDARGDNP